MPSAEMHLGYKYLDFKAFNSWERAKLTLRMDAGERSLAALP